MRRAARVREKETEVKENTEAKEKIEGKERSRL